MNPPCRDCGGELEPYDVPLTLKLISRNATEYLCRDCLAAYFGVERSLIDERLKFFIESECTLFARGER